MQSQESICPFPVCTIHKDNSMQSAFHIHMNIYIDILVIYIMLISAYSENNDIFILPGFSKMGKSLAGYSQSMQFCKAVGARLSYYVIDSHFTATLKECVQSCVRDPDCESLNYQTSSSICELNNFASVFETGLSSDFIHMTRLAPC